MASSSSIIMSTSLAVIMLTIVVYASALPSHQTTTSSGNVSTSDLGLTVNITKPIKNLMASARQARADLSSLARFITPDNLAQMKSLFSGMGGYGSTGLGNVLTFNVGNIVIVTLIAGLALLIAPTILGLFGLGAVGTNIGRSLGLTDEHGHLMDTERVYRAMDSFFQEYNIDARTCLQRFSCAASRKSSTAIRGGNPSYLDSALNYVLESTYVTAVLDKTSMLSAVNYGKAGGDCEIEYGKCPFSWEKVSNYLPVFPFSGIKLTSPFFGGSGAAAANESTSTSKLPQASLNQ